MSIEYKIGNLFDLLPVTKNPIIIPHIVNSIGAWGSGFVVPLGQQWPITKELYLAWERNGYDHERDIPFKLEESQVIHVETRAAPIFVVNMVGQDGIMSHSNQHPIRYGALVSCMQRVERLSHSLVRTVEDVVEIHAPAFGSMRSGGDWGIIANLIEEIWVNHANIKVTIYTLNESEQQGLLAQIKK